MTSADGAKTLLVMMCGLPGSGKSTIARLVEAVCSSAGFDFHLVCLDDIYDAETSSSCKERFSPQTWHHCRAKMLDQARGLVSEDQRSDSTSTNPRVVLVDDNFYYRSMRYPFYQAARQYQVGYFQLFVDTDPSIASRRNRSRVEHRRVPQEVIERMTGRIERPDGGQHLWETNTFRIGNDTDAVSDRGTVGEDTDLSARLLQALKESFNRIPAPLQLLDEQEQARSREENARSVGHVCDLRLRKLVGEYVGRLKASIASGSKLVGEYVGRLKASIAAGSKISASHVGAFAKSLNSHRQTVLSSIHRQADFSLFEDQLEPQLNDADRSSSAERLAKLACEQFVREWTDLADMELFALTGAPEN